MIVQVVPALEFLILRLGKLRVGGMAHLKNSLQFPVYKVLYPQRGRTLLQKKCVFFAPNYPFFSRKYPIAAR